MDPKKKKNVMYLEKNLKYNIIYYTDLKNIISNKFFVVILKQMITITLFWLFSIQAHENSYNHKHVF